METGRTARSFTLRKFMKDGRTEDEAVAAALEAAKAFRAELVNRGVLLEPKAVDPNFTSHVVGVTWMKETQKWIVRLNPEKGKKRIQGGYFREKAAAEAKALELAEAHGLQRRVRAVGRFENRLDGLREVQPKLPYPGVIWRRGEQKWLADIRVGGVKRQIRVRPKDFSEAELERSFQEAVAWRKKQEKEKQKLRNAKAQS